MGGEQATLLDFFGYKEKEEKLQESKELPQVKESDSSFAVESGFIVHPLIKEKSVQAREFQLAIAKKALQGNLIVVIPTGLGKTLIAALVAAEVLRKQPEKKILLLAPTKPLVNQHLETFQRVLKIAGMINFTGELSARKRKSLFASSQVIFSTPQVINNDLEAGRYSIEETSLLIFDEAHRAVGDYAYVPIAKLCKEQLILALTASPGGNRKRIKEVLANLRISHVEARTTSDGDIADYVKGIEISWEEVELSKEMKEIQKLLQSLLYEKISALQKLGFLTYKKAQYISKKDVILAGDAIRKRLAKRRMSYLFGAVHNQNIAMHAYHCLELLETQGVHPLQDYLRRMQEKEKLSRSEKSFLKDERITKVFESIKGVDAISHPKLEKLKEILKKQFANKPDSLVIVFAQYRDTINSIMEELNKIGIQAVKFVGQAARGEERGLTQKEQGEILQRFKGGKYRVLAASSVAEEGLDIPSVDLVVFYEPIPSEIRSIQRRGRTGRSEIGRVVILVARDTRDEAYLYAERAREEKMKKIVLQMSKASRKK